MNHLRDVLTQFETLEADRCERERPIAEPILGTLLDIDTATEIQSWSHSMTEGRPITERHARQISNAGSTTTNNTTAAPASSSLAPPTPRSERTTQTDNSNERTSEASNRFETSNGKTPSERSVNLFLGVQALQCLSFLTGYNINLSYLLHFFLSIIFHCASHYAFSQSTQ